MSTIAVFVNDSGYARDWLQGAAKEHAGAQWLLVACPPKLTRRIGQYASAASRARWRTQWAERLFAELSPACSPAPALKVANIPLMELVKRLQAQHGEGLQVLDLRRPRFAVSEEPLVAPRPVPARHWAVPIAVSSGLSLVLALSD